MFCTDLIVQQYPKIRAQQCSLRDLGYKTRGKSRSQLLWQKLPNGGPKVPKLPARLCVSHDQDTLSKIQILQGHVKVVQQGEETCAGC